MAKKKEAKTAAAAGPFDEAKAAEQCREMHAAGFDLGLLMKVLSLISTFGPAAISYFMDLLKAIQSGEVELRKTSRGGMKCGPDFVEHANDVAENALQTFASACCLKCRLAAQEEQDEEDA